jgi:hypothetical protein
MPLVFQRAGREQFLYLHQVAGLLAAGGTPKGIIERINIEVNNALAILI